MSTGSSNTKPFGKWFQIRWAEKLGDPNNPYLIRWTFILFGRSIRIHHWLRSDDRRFFHDHSANLVSIVLKGRYYNVVPWQEQYPPNILDIWGTIYNQYKINCRYIPVEGMFNSFYNFIHCFRDSIWYSKATSKHYLDIPEEGAWTLLFEGKKYHKWGFYVPKKNDSSNKVRKLRPLQYFHKFGIIQSNPNYQ